MEGLGTNALDSLPATVDESYERIMYFRTYVKGFNAMQEVVPRVWISGEIVARDIRLLQSNGISHIVVANGSRTHFPQNFEYLVLDVEDDPEEDLSPHIDTFLAFMRSALSNGGSVLIHCTLGVSRSASFVLFYLMGEQGLEFSEAMSVLRRARPWVKPNPGFMRRLQEYDLERRNQALGRALVCDLCLLHKRTEWLDDSDPRFVVLLCDQCDLPMVVWRKHEMDINQQDARDMESALQKACSKLGGRYDDIFVDKVQRTITDHLHWHARPRSLFPWLALPSRL